MEASLLLDLRSRIHQSQKFASKRAKGDWMRVEDMTDAFLLRLLRSRGYSVSKVCVIASLVCILCLRGKSKECYFFIDLQLFLRAEHDLPIPPS